MSKQGFRAFAALTLSAFAATSGWAADAHVVPIAELQQWAVSTAQVRQNNLVKSREFLALEPVQAALRGAGMDSERVSHAIALLGDDELARLAARVEKTRADVVAGALTNQQLTYIVIALGTAVIILVLVAA
jgi:hypothetical protein